MVLAEMWNCVCYTKTDQEDWVVSLLDCMDYMDLPHTGVAVEDCRTHKAFAERVVVVLEDS